MSKVLEQAFNAYHEKLGIIDVSTRSEAVQFWVEPAMFTVVPGHEILIDDDTHIAMLKAPLRAIMHRRLGLRGSKTRLSVGPLEALKGLENIGEDALSMGYAVPDAVVVEEARRILHAMHDYRQLPCDAYSMSDGRVGIGVNGGLGRSILLVCEPGGKALCVVTIDRVSRRARYDDSSFLPDDFVKQGLRQLSSGKKVGTGN